MKKYFFDVITNHYIDFKGRARRKQYWMWVLYYLIFCLIYSITVVTIYAVTKADIIAKNASIFGKIYFYILLLPSLGLQVRRLHDSGKSAWWLLVYAIPFAETKLAISSIDTLNSLIIGAIIMIILFCLDSQPGTNKYGPNPKGIN